MNKRFLAYLLTITAFLAVTMLLIAFYMNPPMGDLLELGRLLLITGLISGVVGFISHRMGWWRQFQSLSSALIVSYLVAAGLTLINVWLTARMMFINEHDLALATLLLIFASGVSVSFGAFIANSSTQALRNLTAGADRLSGGDYTTRVQVDGHDEIAQLANSFNKMVAQLELAAQAEQALEETRRNLVAWASHDLRTPLASLQAMIDALAEGVVEDRETKARYLRQSQQEIFRMSRLINDLLELAQLDAQGLSLNRVQASLTDLISDTLESFSERARQSRISLTGSAEDNLDPVWMAPEKISRVLNNLIDNALRHTPRGGHVSIDAILKNNMVEVAVQDSGTGIEPGDQAKIFDHFYRGERSRSRDGYQAGGTGLGLAITKGIIEAHGGQVWLDNTINEGARFVFTLPRQKSGD